MMQNRQKGFTYIELIIAISVLAITSIAAYEGVVAANRFAMISRLRTLAVGMVRNQIDYLQTDGTFDGSTGAVPTALTVGTTTTPNLALYTDPATNKVIVTATLKTEIRSLTFNSLRAATVTATYSYRNRDYSVSMSMLRSPDNISAS